MFVAPYRPLSRDDIVARRQQKLCTLDEKVCDTISVLGLRRRAGARRRQRLQAELKVTSLVNTAHCDGEIPVIIGNRSVTPPASRRPTSEEEIPARQQRKQQQRHVSSSRSVDQLKTTMIDDTNHAILFHVTSILQPLLLLLSDNRPVDLRVTFSYQHSTYSMQRRLLSLMLLII